MTAIPEDIMQEYLGFLDRKSRITDREIDLTEALRRRSPLAESWKRIEERQRAIRSQKDAG